MRHRSGSFLMTQKIDLVVDATHPFAAEVTKNVEQACRMAGTEYIRCVRERQNWDDKGERVVRVEVYLRRWNTCKIQQGMF